MGRITGFDAVRRMRGGKLRLAAAIFCAAASVAANAAGSVKVVTREEKGQPVPDAVASLVAADGPAPALAPPDAPAEIVQKDQDFHPLVTAIVVGTRVAFPNRDNVQHHVYSVSKAKRFEIPLYIGDSKAILFDKPGIVTLGCNIHDWMVAYVDVLATPYFATTGADGTGTIGGLPPGKYRLEIWHPRLAAAVERDVVIGEHDDTTQVISVMLRPDRHIRRAPESGGAGYR